MTEQVFPQLSDFSPEGLVRMADEHDDAAFELALGGHSAMQSAEGFCEILTGIKDPFANMLFGMHVPDAGNRVLAITQRLRELECPGLFWVGPCTTPANLGEILIQNDWVHLASPPAMVIDLESLEIPQLLEGFQLCRVANEEELTVWHQAIAMGFGMSVEVAEMFAWNPIDQIRFYTAFLNDDVVGTTALVLQNGVAGIYCLSTLPEFRARGIGSALTVLPLIEARNEGYRIGTLQSSKMGLPVYLRLGFQEVCKLRMFSFGMP
jgi:GNAT superfamily N-acetyltransferase